MNVASSLAAIFRPGLRGLLAALGLSRHKRIVDQRAAPARSCTFGMEDVLNRPALDPDTAMLRRAIAGRVVMVTGAGGSIGGEMCRQLLPLGPACLLLFDSAEFALYDVHRRLIDMEGSVQLIPLLGSICDRARIDEVVGQWRPDVIYHAAAYKHVPLVEHNPSEAIRTNILGTQVVAEAAARWRITAFVQISTDKAVRPISVMGATKRAAELVVQAMAAGQHGSATRFLLVRFGNVLDSSGSVVPLFREQIASGGPVTITDWRMTRYFMTLSEAAALVLQASTMAKGGEVFVLDMGAPVRIVDLARKMIALSGLRVHDDAASAPPHDAVMIREIGLRPGEKLHEERLITPDVRPTLHPRIHMSLEPARSHDDVIAHLDRIGTALGRAPVTHLLALLRDMVPEYAATRPVLDWVHLARRDSDDQSEAIAYRAV